MFTRRQKQIETFKKAILDLLRENTQGEDLIADRVLRKLGISCRGRNRDKLRKRVSRVITDLKRKGAIETYETATRKRLRVTNNQLNLFD